MASYGPYETNREIASAQGAAVYSARKAGDAADAYAIKVFSVESFVGEGLEARTDLDPLVADLNRSFHERIALQKKVAESSRHVAPIFDSGDEGIKVCPCFEAFRSEEHTS